MSSKLLHRKIFIIVAFVVLFLPFASGQNNKFKPETYIGLSAGPAGSMVFFKPTVKQDYLLAYQGGLMFRYISEKHLGIQLELNYAQRGWSEVDGAFDKKLDYIELPFLSHFYLGNKAKFFFNIGPQLGYMLHESSTNTGIAAAHQQKTAIQNRFEYGLSAGFGLQFQIKKQAFQLETRGNFAASDIFSNKKTEYFGNSNLITASVTLGWLMQVNK